MAPSSSTAAAGRDLFGRRRRPEGTRRRQLEWITNFALVVVSLLGISVGAGLIVFYKMDHFGFISWQFTYIPWILLGGGVYTLFVSFFGLAAVAQKSPALLVIYSFLLFVSFLILCAGVFMTVSVSIMVEKDVESGPFLDTIANYGHERAATREIDLIQKTYRCCGEAQLNRRRALGYKIWYEHHGLKSRFAVPDSCCIHYEEGCGSDLFGENDNVNSVATHATHIFIHGCMDAITSVLETQIQPVLLVFAIVGALLAMLELLGVVLACALAHVIRRLARQKRDMEQARR